MTQALSSNPLTPKKIYSPKVMEKAMSLLRDPISKESIDYIARNISSYDDEQDVLFWIPLFPGFENLVSRYTGERRGRSGVMNVPTDKSLIRDVSHQDLLERIVLQRSLSTSHPRLFEFLGTIGNVIQGATCAGESTFGLFTAQNPSATYDNCQKKAEEQKKIILGVLIAVAVAVALVVFLFIYCKCRKDRQQDRLMKSVSTLATAQLVSMKEKNKKEEEQTSLFGDD